MIRLKGALLSLGVACAVAAALSASGCAQDSTIHASGSVIDQVTVIQAPLLQSPQPNPDAGFASSGVQTATGTSGPSRSTPTTISAVTGLGSVSRVASVPVSLGQSVSAGDVLVEFDAGALDAAITAARADARATRAQVQVLGDALDKTGSAESKIASNRKKLDDTIAQLTETRAQLVTKLAQLEAMLAQLEAMSKASGGSTASTAGASPPGGMTPAQLRATIAQLQTSIRKIDTGLAKARSGLSQLNSARATLADTRTQLSDVRDVARIAADAADLGVLAAQYQRSLATVRAPVSGIVVDIASVGDALSPGATLATIREQKAPRITTWLAAADLPRIALGDRVTVGADWFAPGAALPTGRITRIGQRADYPPTSFATKDVHLTRGVPVDITLDASLNAVGETPAGPLPPGTPVDVTILPKTSGTP